MKLRDLKTPVQLALQAKREHYERLLDELGAQGIIWYKWFRGDSPPRKTVNNIKTKVQMGTLIGKMDVKATAIMYLYLNDDFPEKKQLVQSYYKKFLAVYNKIESNLK